MLEALQIHQLGADDRIVQSYRPSSAGVVHGLREYTCYAIELITQAPMSLVVDDELLAKATGGTATRWLWTPLFYAGVVQAELISDDGTPTVAFSLDVTPDPSKVGSAEFDLMLADILAFDPELLLGTEASTEAIGAEGQRRNPMIEFWRLRQYGPRFLGLLKTIASDPISRVASNRQQTPIELVRRIDTATVRSLCRQPGLLAELRGGRQFRQGNGTAQTLDVPTILPTVDNPANRAIVSLARRILQRVVGVRAQLAELVHKESPSDTRTPLSRRWPRRKELLDALEASLRRALASWPFNRVTRTEITAAALTQIAAHPIYARAFRFGHRSLRSGTEGAADSDRTWLPPTWEIYERWCFAYISNYLRAAHADCSWRWEESRYCRAESAFVGETQDGNMRVELLFQPVFASGGPGRPDRFSSLSMQRIPDIVLAVDSSKGRQFVVLDAKYRSQRPGVLDAMSSAHIYHDSLRWNGEAPTFALLLVPEHYDVDWLAAEQFIYTHGVGVLRLKSSKDERKSTKDLMESLINAAVRGGNEVGRAST